MMASDSRLRDLIAESRARVDAMTPAERDYLWQAQRESFARAMAPCEHGEPDWETCPGCLTFYRKAGI